MTSAVPAQGDRHVLTAKFQTKHVKNCDQSQPGGLQPCSHTAAPAEPPFWKLRPAPLFHQLCHNVPVALPRPVVLKSNPPDGPKSGAVDARTPHSLLGSEGLGLVSNNSKWVFGSSVWMDLLLPIPVYLQTLKLNKPIYLLFPQSNMQRIPSVISRLTVISSAPDERTGTSHLKAGYELILL